MLEGKIFKKIKKINLTLKEGQKGFKPIQLLKVAI